MQISLPSGFSAATNARNSAKTLSHFILLPWNMKYWNGMRKTPGYIYYTVYSPAASRRTVVCCSFSRLSCSAGFSDVLTLHEQRQVNADNRDKQTGDTWHCDTLHCPYHRVTQLRCLVAHLWYSPESMFIQVTLTQKTDNRIHHVQRHKSEDFQIYILFDTTNTGLTTSVNRWHYRIPFVSMYGFFQFCSIRSTRLNIIMQFRK